MAAPFDAQADDVARLRRCLSDMVSIMALPALWTRKEPQQIVITLLDALLGMLPLAFVFVRLNEVDGRTPIDLMRTAGRMGDTDLHLTSVQLGVDGELGFVVAASESAGFPEQTERLLLEIAANQAVIGLQQAQLLSEQKRVASEEQSRLISELAHVSRVGALGALTASIAHEINQPLSGIITNAGTCVRMLDADPPNIDGARETARRTIRDGNRAADVIARLRALFSKRELTLESMDMNEATREVIALSLNDLQRHRVIMQSEFTSDVALVTGDRIQLQQVILNLIRNASDAMADVEERPRQLLIRTECEDNSCVRLTMRDTGVGLGGQHLDRIFDAFHTTKSGGMGIGLSVSRAIIERHHGRLWAEHNDGPGATFAFSIPGCAPH